MNEHDRRKAQAYEYEMVSDQLLAAKTINASVERRMLARIEALEAAIRKHRDTGLDDGSDQGELDEELWSILDAPSD